MNAPLPLPALHRPRPRVAVIGAGPGGLAAAMLLAANGLRVTLFEKDSVVGGRSRTLSAPGGYRFDLGPTFFLYPRILREIFARCGADLDEEVELRQLDPQYRLLFEGSGARIDATPNVERMEAEIARLCPRDAKGLRPFLAENARKLAAFRPVLERAFCSPADVLSLDMLKSLPLLRPGRSVDADLARHFRDPRVRLAFSFQTKYLGMSPFRCPALFTILSFLEYEHGVFHPMGGCGSVATAMARVAERLGVEVRLDTPVERIAFDGRRARGVETAHGLHVADAVVVNSDFAGTIPKLIPDALRKRWTDTRISKARYSCSTFMLYLGVEGTFPELSHHNILLSEDYRRNIHQIEQGELPDVPSLYLQHAGATDPSMAPPGHSALYLLIPVPNLRAGSTDWATEAPHYRRMALERIRGLGLPDLEPLIRYERMVTPRDWEQDFGVGFGATFNLSHDLGQMLCFRPGNRFADTGGIYLVGGGTHPGSGLPVIYEGARITSHLLAQDLGVTPIDSPEHAFEAGD